ncbi:MAG TPA: D-alanine--D-alanine ligase, partial [Rhodothermales bacterium]
DPNEAIPSVLEEPVRTDASETLSFEDKYLRGGSTQGKAGRRGTKASSGGSGSSGMASLDRIIPARLSEERTAEIRDLAVRIFKLFECGGVARIDFMIEETTDRVFFNEINTIPGSFSFYLWEPTGIPFDQLTHRMIEIALQRHRAKNGRVRSYETNLLSLKSLAGLKGKG